MPSGVAASFERRATGVRRRIRPTWRIAPAPNGEGLNPGAFADTTRGNVAIRRQRQRKVASECVPTFRIRVIAPNKNRNVAIDRERQRAAEAVSFRFALAEPVEDQHVGARPHRRLDQSGRVFKSGGVKSAASRVSAQVLRDADQLAAGGRATGASAGPLSQRLQRRVDPTGRTAALVANASRDDAAIDIRWEHVPSSFGDQHLRKRHRHALRRRRELPCQTRFEPVHE